MEGSFMTFTSGLPFILYTKVLGELKSTLRYVRFYVCLRGKTKIIEHGNHKRT
jgi:hypothetical protein